MTLNEVGQILRKARKSKGWSQQYVVDVLGYNQRDISEIELGLRNAYWRRIAEYSELFGYEAIIAAAHGDEP